MKLSANTLSFESDANGDITYDIPNTESTGTFTVISKFFGPTSVTVDFATQRYIDVSPVPLLAIKITTVDDKGNSLGGINVKFVKNGVEIKQRTTNAEGDYGFLIAKEDISDSDFVINVEATDPLSRITSKNLTINVQKGEVYKATVIQLIGINAFDLFIGVTDTIYGGPVNEVEV